LRMLVREAGQSARCVLTWERELVGAALEAAASGGGRNEAGICPGINEIDFLTSPSRIQLDTKERRDAPVVKIGCGGARFECATGRATVADRLNPGSGLGSRRVREEGHAKERREVDASLYAEAGRGRNKAGMCPRING
jgi:hypothetical protein